MTNRTQTIFGIDEKAVICLSGGLDSTVMLSMLIAQGFKTIYPLFFSYGSKHNTHEMNSFRRIIGYYGMDQNVRIFNMYNVFVKMESDLLNHGGDIPEGHYCEPSMSRTVVPGRNAIFISVAAGFAQSVGATKVYIAAHSGDHHIYPDCRPDFLEKMKDVVELMTERKVKLAFPFRDNDKADIVKIGHGYGAPFELTRTCYKNQPIACGRCGSCTERLEAFHKNSLTDPLDYENQPGDWIATDNEL